MENKSHESPLGGGGLMYKNSPTEYSSFIIVYGEGVTSMPVAGTVEGYDSAGDWQVHVGFTQLKNGAGEYPISEVVGYHGTVTRFSVSVAIVPPIPGAYNYSATVTGNVITINKL